MKEQLLQYIWQFRYFNLSQTTLVSGEDLQIIFPGTLNTNQGPDFLEAKLKIGNTTWVGNVEIHPLSSDWNKHHHAQDQNYKNIILHVVWEQDKETDPPLPTFELKSRVPKLLLSRYSEWMMNDSFTRCGKDCAAVSAITWLSFLERLLFERLLRKSEMVTIQLKKTQFNWEETFWWMLAKNFGHTVNTEAFGMIAASLPVNLLAKHKDNLVQLESLLLGQAGLLESEVHDKYAVLLQKEYHFLAHKYQLQPVAAAVHFLRMRPVNFPTIRLAQLAMLIHRSSHLFSKIKSAGTPAECLKLFTVSAGDYWYTHYTFDEISLYREKTVGPQMAENLLINTVIPVLFAYGHLNKEMQYKEKALQWLTEIAPEKNNILRGWKETGIPAKNAFDSQALMELKTRYCNERKCLQCAIGNILLKTTMSG